MLRLETGPQDGFTKAVDPAIHKRLTGYSADRTITPGPVGGPAPGHRLGPVQHLRDPQLPLQGGPPAEARPLLPLELHPRRPGPHRVGASRAPRPGPLRDPQLPEAPNPHRPMDRRVHRARQAAAGQATGAHPVSLRPTPPSPETTRSSVPSVRPRLENPPERKAFRGRQVLRSRYPRLL